MLYFVFMMALTASLPVRGGETDVEQDTIQKFFASRGMQVDLKKREVRLEASVCLKKGILEYLVCRPNSYEHESIFVTSTKAQYLHLALSLVGLRESTVSPPLFFLLAKSRKLQHSRIGIDVEYKVDGKEVRCRLSKLLVNRADKETELPNEWIFSGSQVLEKNGKTIYAADDSGAVVSIVPNGNAVVQFGEETSNPYQGEDKGMEANPNAVPAVGTLVKLVFKPLGDTAPPVAPAKKE
ncbi:MAG: YdjY domain-containing protein [Planctomycetota bacterium]|nr:YdjY domain-containing protein [Planctomycetota bacterium]MDA1138047.1 YdjY domain-containing protein [Planctomycetota bacterium]